MRCHFIPIRMATRKKKERERKEGGRKEGKEERERRRKRNAFLEGLRKGDPR